MFNILDVCSIILVEKSIYVTIIGGLPQCMPPDGYVTFFISGALSVEDD
jgi:hypothetical protein